MQNLHRRLARIAVAIALAVLPHIALADVVLLDNGDRVSGRIVQIDGGKLVVSMDYAGDIKIDPGHIKDLQADGDFTLVLDDGRRVFGRLGSGRGTLYLTETVAGSAQEIPLPRVTSLTPGRVTGDEWKVTGRVNVGASDTTGNTHTSRAHLDAELVARKDRDRYTVGGAGNQATDSGSEIESNALAYFKYDRFFTKRWYAYANSTFERDRFKDLRLRSTFGIGTGFQAIDSPRTRLALESGLEYVFTRFYTSQKHDFPALRLALKFDHYLVPDRLQFFQYTEGYASLENIKTSFARSQTGLRFPLIDNFVATAQLNVDWDGEPAPGRKSVDQTALFTLGYTW